ncbi:transcriptional regulator [Sulfitobacter sp. SK012]|uniref:ChrR family anti-sigma-E factor n=1 Tax=Sulfitobacter sp. SK012 TaxID=1389005 RepID=UPI000E0B8E5D|nr:ChrR family anti-sigma-E factor [Sulfitobacter sp. SK012]AXI48241.1 transcriptional regulator [Sulfitobacter sp. SK012]
MTKINHHLDDDTLMAYATGSLPEAFNLIVAAHVSMCDVCRAAADSFDTLGGAVLEEEDVASLSETSLARTLAQLKERYAEVPATRRPAGALPAPLQDYVGGDLDAIRWRPVGMGVKQAILKTSTRATARLLFIPAGAAMPDHGHHGTEMTLVLQGAFHDDDEVFARGDIEIADSDVQHIPVADIACDCICLAVTDAPLRFAGWLPRLVQKFVRI